MAGGPGPSQKASRVSLPSLRIAPWPAPREASSLPDTTSSGRWLVSARADVTAFGGSALLALLIIVLAHHSAPASQGLPEWVWVSCILLVDVAHVWSTVWRTYLVPGEMRQHPWRYILVPLVGYLGSAALYALGPLVFWRCLAYLAVYHFVRQQYGWVMLYRARVGERDTLGRLLDATTIYLCTLYPLAWWHAHLPRAFHWFLDGDFVGLGAPLATWGSSLVAALGVLWGVLLGLYALRALHAWHIGRPNPGKDLVVLTTAVCWYAGIIGSNSDLTFTVTNVLIHGLPYMGLMYAYTRSAAREGRLELPRAWTHPLVWLATLWVIAYVEELFWDQAVWHDRAWLFGPGVGCTALHTWIVPLLALPQLVHYVLDGLIWRRDEAWIPWKSL